ncbi:hypothetical protein CYMTET_40630 [Cymbomonas tetramitiformis]|uniref:RCC1-like domain-containing protein n=1 Tax=Cymbomonas tetramitiformis TaxID=36881 RepID=A0AAE0C8Z7_9CHLO|nr:hypothetical protein CYMTET_40630 [Cymbomonas tetramitiformis]
MPIHVEPGRRRRPQSALAPLTRDAPADQFLLPSPAWQRKTNVQPGRPPRPPLCPLKAEKSLPSRSFSACVKPETSAWTAMLSQGETNLQDATNSRENSRESNSEEGARGQLSPTRQISSKGSQGASSEDDLEIDEELEVPESCGVEDLEGSGRLSLQPSQLTLASGGKEKKKKTARRWSALRGALSKVVDPRPTPPEVLAVSPNGAEIRWECQTPAQFAVEVRALAGRRWDLAVEGVPWNGGRGQVHLSLPPLTTSYVRVYQVLKDGRRGYCSRASMVSTEGAEPPKERGVQPWELQRLRRKRRDSRGGSRGKMTLLQDDISQGFEFTMPESKAEEVEEEGDCEAARKAKDDYEMRILREMEGGVETEEELEKCEPSPPAAPPPPVVGPALDLLPDSLLVYLLSRFGLEAQDLAAVSMLGTRFRRRAREELVGGSQLQISAFYQQDEPSNTIWLSVVEAAAMEAVSIQCHCWHLGQIKRKGSERWVKVLHYTSNAVVRWNSRGNQALAANEESTVLGCANGQVYSCGRNTNGEAGHGDNKPKPVLELVHALRGGPRSRIRQVSAGHNFCMLLSGAGEIVSWGLNAHGELGHGDKTARSTPVVIRALQGTSVAQLSAGGNHAVAVTQHGEMYAWGHNANGQLGLGQTVSYTKPQVVKGDAWRLLFTRPHQVSCGSFHTLLALEDGSVAVWGKGMRGVLGGQSSSDALAPQLVEPLRTHKVVHVAAGAKHCMALTAEGDVYTWGSNEDGALGVGSSEESGPHDFSSFPHAVLTSCRVVQISAGRDFSLAITAFGLLYAWGTNSNGELGTGDSRPRDTPTMVTDFECDSASVLMAAAKRQSSSFADQASKQHWTKFASREAEGSSSLNWQRIKDVVAGHTMSMYVAYNGDLYTCGTNSNGELGHGDTRMRRTASVVQNLRARWLNDQRSGNTGYVVSRKHPEGGLRCNGAGRLAAALQALEVQPGKLDITGSGGWCRERSAGEVGGTRGAVLGRAGGGRQTVISEVPHRPELQEALAAPGCERWQLSTD